jgi:exonuclease III
MLDIPMRIVSANLNQRLGNPAARSRVGIWLGTKAPDLFLSQEPFKPSQQERPSIGGYRLVSTSPLISCWIAQRHPCPKVVEHSERWHEIRHNGVCAHNVYLSPNSSAERRALLNDLSNAIREAEANAMVITGDFNLAPRLEDGLFGDQPSTFTRPPERRAFEDLLASANLVDATCPSPGGNLEFTFERVRQGRPNRFRCDLALISSHISEAAAVKYDHSVRALPGAPDRAGVVVLGRQRCDLLLNERSAWSNLQRPGRESWAAVAFAVTVLQKPLFLSPVATEKVRRWPNKSLAMHPCPTLPNGLSICKQLKTGVLHL